MGNEIVDADEIKDEVALLREKLKVYGAETLHQKSKPNRKTKSKSKPIKKNAGLKKGRRKEASSSEAMVWIDKGREYGPMVEEKALECYEKAEELKPSYYLIYKDRAKLFHILKKFEKAVENYDLAQKHLIASPSHGGIIDPGLREEKERALQKKLIQNPYPWKYTDIDIIDSTIPTVSDNDTYKSKGLFYQKLGDWEKAIEWYNKIKDPHFGDSGEFWHMKAKCFSKLGNIENAVECLKNGRDRGGYPHIDYEEDARELANEEFNVSYGEDEE